MKRLFFTISFLAILCGVIGVALQFMFGSNVITYIQRVRINEIWIYQYDFSSYATNLQQSLATPNLDLKIPTREWGWGADDILNDLAVIVNILILTINVLLYPLRLGALVVRTILSLVGINVINPDPSNPLNWLINPTEGLLARLNGLMLGYI